MTEKEKNIEDAWDAVEISAKNLTLAKMAKEKGLPEFNSSGDIDAITCFRLVFIKNIKSWFNLCRELKDVDV